MRLYERYADAGFHTCIASTFGIDFGAYEDIVLPRLRGAGCHNNLLLVDGRMLTYALDGASTLPDYAGRHYTVAGVPADGVFHPKITLQLGRRSGRLLIGSANMTAAGLAGNLELAGRIDCTNEPGGEAQVIAAAWDYLRDALGDGAEGLGYQLRWLEPRTPWLMDTQAPDGPVLLGDSSLAALLTSGGSMGRAGIGARFAALVEERPVHRLTVLSPYWDDRLAALSALAEAFGAPEIVILIDCDAGLFPAEAAKALPDCKFFDLNSFAGERFIHAKAIIAETHQADHVLYGSANCTPAALGTATFAGSNFEACLYRRLEPGTILSVLGLDKVIAGSSPMRPEDLPVPQDEEPLPLGEAASRFPGRFEYRAGTLSWMPPHAGHWQDSELELLDGAGNMIPAFITPRAEVTSVNVVENLG